MREGVDAMGRGRAKAKQTKVARELKYFSPDTDLTALLNQLIAYGVPVAAPSYTSQPPGFVQVELHYPANAPVGQATDDLSELWHTATIPRPTILTDSEDLRFLLFKRNVPTELPA